MSDTKSLTDPLENAKLEAPGTKKRRSVAVPVEDAPRPDPVVAQVPDRVERFVVQRDITISWGSSMARLRAGDVVSDASHGAGAVDRMRRSGVDLRPAEKGDPGRS